MMLMSEDITKLAAALVKAQAEMEGAKKASNNPAFRSKYADLASVVDAVKPALNKHGLAYIQMPERVVDGAVEIETMLLHDSGQWLRSVLHVPLGKRDAQGVGSAISYGRRYALMALCGIPAEDDDGNAASAPAPVRRGPPSPPPADQPPRHTDEEYADFASAIALCMTAKDMEETAMEHGMDKDRDQRARKILADHWRTLNPGRNAA